MEGRIVKQKQHGGYYHDWYVLVPLEEILGLFVYSVKRLLKVTTGIDYERGYFLT